MNFCTICKQFKNERMYLKNRNKTKPDGYYCRSCNTEYVRRYRKTKNGKVAIYKAIKKYDSANPERRRAWEKAKILPKKPCEVCGDENTHRHHPDISKPLDIIYLCPQHHKEADRLKACAERI